MTTEENNDADNPLADGRHVPNDPVQAKERLVKDGVDFRIPDGEAEVVGSAEECLVYYVVTLFFQRRSKDYLLSQAK